MNEKILIVDDHENNRISLAHTFLREGYDVKEAENGYEAINKAREVSFHLALLDIRLPDIDGLKLLSILKEMDPDIICIMMTAYASLETAVKSLNRGAARYITKPVNVEEALVSIRDTLEKQQLVRENRKLLESIKQELNERKRAQKALRENEEKFRQLAENIHEVFWIGSPDFKEMYYISPAYEDIWGCSCNSLYENPLSWLDSIPEEDREKIVSTIEKGLPRDSSVVNLPEFRIIRPDDTLRWICARAYPIVSSNKQVLRIAGIAEDVTERKKAEEALKKNEELYRKAIEAAGAVPYFINLSKERYEYIGEGIKQIIGYSSEEFTRKIWKSSIRAFIPFGKLAGLSYPQVNRRIREGKEHAWRADFKIKARDGELRWIHNSSIITKNSEHYPFGSLGILQDITERKKMEDQARLQQHQLMQADKLTSLGVLVSGMAHEINNPNQVIMANSVLMMEVWKSIIPILDSHYEKSGDFVLGGLSYSEIIEKIPVLLEGIHTMSAQIKNIVAELKNFSRQEAYCLEQSIDINQVVRCSVELSIGYIKKATRSFKVEYDKDLPYVKGNFQKLEQVVINLIQNACQALDSRQESILISTSYDKKRRSVQITIRDEGVGISSADLSKVTDVFFTTRRESGGTGLGLSISSKIIEDHSGALNLISEPGKGTTATIALPEKNFENAGR